MRENKRKYNRTVVTKYVSKKEAKRLIDESPSDNICVTIINVETHTSGNTEWMKKFDGYKLIEKAKSIDYENHSFFGRMELMNVLKEPNFIHCITFAQKEVIKE